MAYDTAVQQAKDPKDTSCDNQFGSVAIKPNLVLDPHFNRACERYAKKHNITEEAAFKKLHK